MELPNLVVVYGYRSFAAFEIAAGLQGVCQIIWLIDAEDPSSRDARRMLERIGPVIDALGSEPAAAAEALAPHAPDGIVTFYDTGMEHVAAIAAALGLRFHSLAAGRALEDKLEQRRALAAAGIPTPAAEALPDAGGSGLEEIASTVGFPAIVKPRRSSGSWRTARVQSRAELAELWHELDTLSAAGTGPPPRDYLMEAYLEDGPPMPLGFEENYVSVETVALDGEFQHLAVTARLPLAEPFRETGYFLPAALDDGACREVYAAASAALAAIGFETGCAHTELKLTAAGWRLIEVNGRIGGGIPNMLRLAAGIELFALTARAALGTLERQAPPRFDAIGYRFFYQPPVGRYRLGQIRGVPELKAMEGVQSVYVHHPPGTVIDSDDGTRTYLLDVVGVAERYDDVREMESVMARTVEVDYAPADGPESPSLDAE